MSSIIFRKALAFLKFISEEKIDEPAIWQKTLWKVVVAAPSKFEVFFCVSCSQADLVHFCVYLKFSSTRGNFNQFFIFRLSTIKDHLCC